MARCPHWLPLPMRDSSRYMPHGTPASHLGGTRDCIGPLGLEIWLLAQGQVCGITATPEAAKISGVSSPVVQTYRIPATYTNEDTQTREPDEFTPSPRQGVSRIQFHRSRSVQHAPRRAQRERRKIRQVAVTLGWATTERHGPLPPYQTTPSPCPPLSAPSGNVCK